MNTKAGVISAALAVMLVGSIAMTHAQRGRPQSQVIPVAANTVAANPEGYYGATVTVTAAVQQVFSLPVFSVAQRTIPGAANAAAMTRDVLVVAPYLQAPLAVNVYVTVMGEVVPFDPAAIATKARGPKVDFPPDVVAKYQGRPVIVATAVIDAMRVNLARRLPPPMTAEETAYSTTMKRIGPSFAALRTAIDAMNVEGTKNQIAVLGPAFADTEAFWKARGAADALQWAQDARKQIASIERGMAGSEWTEMKAQAGVLGQACQSCHAARRDRFDDGSFRVIADAK